MALPYVVQNFTPPRLFRACTRRRAHYPGRSGGRRAGLPLSSSEAVLLAARTAFVGAFQFTALAGAALVMLAACVTWRILRRRPGRPGVQAPRRQDADSAGEERRLLR